MRDCGRFEDALWEAAEEGRPSPRLAAHLEQCATCRRALEEITAGVADLAGLRAVRAPDPRLALRAKLTRSPRRGRLVVALAVVTACLVAALALSAGWQVRRPAPAPQVVVRSDVGTGAAVAPIAPRPKPPATVTVVSTDRKQQNLRPRPAVQARRPAARALRAKAQIDQGEAGRARPRAQESGRPVTAVSLDEPCPQTTVLYPRRPEPPRPQFITADPTYRALPQPARLVAVEGETPESARPIL